jgi:hypothetical protein
LKASIDIVHVLTFQSITFRSRDKSVSSINHENFLKILDLTISYNEQFVEVITKTLKNVTYTSPLVQKEILYVFSTKVKELIHDEIGDAKFCLTFGTPNISLIKICVMAILFHICFNNGFTIDVCYIERPFEICALPRVSQRKLFLPQTAS